MISGNLEFSIASTDNPVVISHNNTALDAVQRGARLTQQLLSFARKQPMMPVVLDVGKLVRDSTLLIRTSVGESIDLEIISDAGLWRAITDQAQLEAVLLNLVVNARDAMPDGGSLIIECSNARLDTNYARANMEVAPGNYVCISVTDSGHGMSEDVIKQCIEPFFTTKAIGQGTGLGLSMAFGFAKQSKGHLKICSEERHGTTIRLYLPWVKQDVAQMPAKVPIDHRTQLAGLHVFMHRG
ncbi:ATP-binding protein [Granulosicoccus antarcticus]|uniref:histidine kinase n=1 Tax=Granulosicoccus antarcticus IMCC3135 TaxID=1192854 RepID=A0A2Z2NL71_9GAMM|nr:ATP-binding protein [Granulosicoccus antarcticus]ASJ71899.1 Blue-light-activated protein [Granulosicoccus antarcticus IMCC3135]